MLDRRQYIFLGVVAGVIVLAAGVAAWYFLPRSSPATPILNQMFICLQRGDLAAVRGMANGETAKARDPRTGETALHVAARIGDPEAVTILLGAGADPNARDKLRGSTPLHNAVATGSTRAMERLLAGGADPNVRDSAREHSPLHDAIDTLRLRAARSAADAVLDRAPAPSPSAAPAPASRPGEGTPLDAVRLLLKFKADPNLPNAEGRTSLHLAALVKGPAGGELVAILLAAGADANRSDKQKQAPLHLAAESDSPAVAALLAGKADPNLADAAGRTPLHAAARADLGPCVTLLLAAGGKPDVRDAAGQLPLQAALAAGSQAAEALVDGGADLTAADTGGESLAARALKNDKDFAIFRLWTRVLLAPANARRAAELLGRDKAAAALRGPGGITLLHKAADQANLPAAQALLALGADPNARTAEGLTPLHLAVLYTPQLASDADPRGPRDPEGLGRQKDFMALLCDRGADVNAADATGLTPLAYAARQGRAELVDLLLARKADPSRADNFGATPMIQAALFNQQDVLQKMIAAGAPLDLYAATALSDAKAIAQLTAGKPQAARVQAGREKYSPLHVAGLAEDPGVAEALLSAGADVDARDAQGRTPLHLAAGLSLPYVQLLVRHGAKLAAVDAQGRTPLHTIVASASAPVIQFLVDSGANVNARDAQRRTPLAAAPLHRTDIRKLLRTLGGTE